MRVTKEKRTFYIVAIEEQERDAIVDAIHTIGMGGEQHLNGQELKALTELRLALLNEG